MYKFLCIQYFTVVWSVKLVVKSSDIWLASTGDCDVQPSWELLCSRKKPIWLLVLWEN